MAVWSELCKKCGRCCTGCKYFNESVGCAVKYEERQLSCRLYPFIHFLLEDRLLLDPECPAWDDFGKQYENAKEILRDSRGGK